MMGRSSSDDIDINYIDYINDGVMMKLCKCPLVWLTDLRLGVRRICVQYHVLYLVLGVYSTKYTKYTKYTNYTWWKYIKYAKE